LSSKDSRAYLAAIFLIFVFHFVCAAGFFSNVDIDSGFPVLNDDYSIHFGHVDPVKEFFRDSYRLWGYDPFYMAGLPKSTVFDADAKSPEIIGVIFSFADSATVYNIYIFLNYILAPLLFLWSIFNFGLRRWGLATGFAAGVFYWWAYPAFRFNLAGQFAFIFVSHITLLIFSLFYRYVDSGKFRFIALCGVIGAIALSVHILAPINIAVGSLILYAVAFKKMSGKQHAGLFACLAFILIANSPWVIPFIRFYGMNNLADIDWFFGATNPFFFLEAYFPGGAIYRYLRLAILIASIGGFMKWKKENNILFYPVLGNALILFIYSYFGAYSTLTFLQNPWRYEFELNLFLLAPAAVYLNSLFEKNGFSRKILPLAVSLFLIVCLFPLNAFKSAKRLIPRYRNERIVKYDRLTPLKNGEVEYSYEELPHSSLPPAGYEFIEWIKRNTTKDARIMLEDSCWQSRHAYWGSHLPAMLPTLTGREYIGGPIPQYFMVHHYASFQDGFFCGKYLDEYDEEEFLEKTDLYNIKWIVAFTPYSRNFLEKIPERVHLIDRVDKFYLYEITRKQDFFLEGRGEIKSAYNHLYLSGLSEGEDIIIKYHWIKTLKTSPPRKLSEFKIKDDPVGFIKVENVPSEIEIYNGY